MDYKKLGSSIYARLDKGDEIIACILDICRNENILSAVYSGIGACNEAEVRTFLLKMNTDTIKETAF